MLSLIPLGLGLAGLGINVAGCVEEGGDGNANRIMALVYAIISPLSNVAAPLRHPSRPRQVRPMGEGGAARRRPHQLSRRRRLQPPRQPGGRQEVAGSRSLPALADPPAGRLGMGLGGRRNDRDGVGLDPPPSVGPGLRWAGLPRPRGRSRCTGQTRRDRCRAQDTGLGRHARHAHVRRSRRTARRPRRSARSRRSRSPGGRSPRGQGHPERPPARVADARGMMGMERRKQGLELPWQGGFTNPVRTRSSISSSG